MYGYAAASASVNAGGSQIDSSYQSVTEQSAIRAGDGGFQVKSKAAMKVIPAAAMR